MKKEFTAICVCRKLCTSKPGLTLHHRKCKVAQEDIRAGRDGILKTNIIESVEYIDQAKEFLNLAQEAAADIHFVLAEGNRSAGRRARVTLNCLRQKIVPLRRLILEKIKNNHSK